MYNTNIGYVILNSFMNMVLNMVFQVPGWGWTSTTCTSRSLPWGGWFHPSPSTLNLTIRTILLGGSGSQDLDTWLITMVIVFVPDSWGCGTPSKWPKWLINGGDPNHLTGMILQVDQPFYVHVEGTKGRLEMRIFATQASTTFLK